MGVHAYCIIPALHTPPAQLRGVHDEPVSTVAAGELGVWVSHHDAPPPPSAVAARAHNNVVRVAMTQTLTPVPVRFGQWFNHDEAAAQQVAEHADRWLERLRHFAGRAEYGVRVERPEEASSARDVRPEPLGSGRAYMAALAARQAAAAARHREAREIAAAIGAAVGDLVADTRVEEPTTAGTVLRVAHLVAWREVEAYHSQLGVLPSTRPIFRFLFTGPWPPYTFVS